MQQLVDIYGYCVIPENTLLFRGQTDKSFYDCMFFATKYCVASSFNESIQIWKTETDITVLFLVDYLDNRSWTYSALPRLFNSLFPAESNPNFDDLDIKHRDINRRNKLVRKLFDDYKISGWLTSLESKVEIEVCLFDKQTNSKQLVLLDTLGRKNKDYVKDSLDRIKIFPTDTFHKKTSRKLNERASIFKSEKDYYKGYKKIINACIKDEVQNGMSKIEAEHYYLNLRIKLKI